MGTKGTRSSGSQINPKGVAQGNTLVDPNTGQPVDVVTDTNGVRRLAVDANITAQVPAIEVELDYENDSVQIGDPNTDATLKINSDGSVDANVEVDAADGDSIAVVGTEDGTPTGVQHTIKINERGNLTVEVLNRLVQVPYNKITVTSKDSDGQPLGIDYRLNGNLVAQMVLVYDADGDFQDTEVTYI